MIISCINCVKKFDISSDLIPDKGRLLKCNSCNHQWFFKKNNLVNDSVNLADKIIKNTEEETISAIKNKFSEFNQEETSNIEIFSSNSEEDIYDNKVIENEQNTKIIKKKTKMLSYMIVFIISFTGIIILIDTFKLPISNVIPNIENILYNLYESIKDIKLFLNDLI